LRRRLPDSYGSACQIVQRYNPGDLFLACEDGQPANPSLPHELFSLFDVLVLEATNKVGTHLIAHGRPLVQKFVPSYAHFVTHNRMGLKAIGLFWGGGTLRLAAISLGSPTSRFFSALERRQLVVRSHNETLSVVAMRVSNEDRSTVGRPSHGSGA